MTTTPEAPLVERLRDGVYGLNRIALCEEAAAEIERLTAELAAVRALLPDDLSTGSKDWAQGDTAQRVDCLKTWLDDARSEARVAYLAFDRVSAERDALRAERESILRAVAGSGLMVVMTKYGAHLMDAGKMQAQPKEPSNG